MLQFTKNFNCCKTVTCESFGDSESKHYIHRSERLGYLSTECTLCGSHPPWINNQLIKEVLAEKLGQYFGQKVVGCKQCRPYFFDNASPAEKLHGFTSAGTQRKRCAQCRAIFTLPAFKNIDALKKVLTCLVEKKEIKAAIKESGLAARLYYFYLNKLALIFANFSRLNEQQVLHREYLGIHSEGRFFELAHQRGFYALFSAEIDSGYILLQSNNLTKLTFLDTFIYHETENTMLDNIDSNDIEAVLLGRYQGILKRNHFEQLIIGNAKPIAKCHAIYPDKAVYVHFQLLRLMTANATRYEHYIEHESVLRAASLMSSLADIKKGTANIYYFLPFISEDHQLSGKKLGWWNDIWFSNKLGAFSALTGKLKRDPTFNLQKGSAIEDFYCYLKGNLNNNVNSKKVIDDSSEVFRVLYNYCHIEHTQTPACSLGLAHQVYRPEQLLEIAIKQLTEQQ
ncbi:MAG: hypothetical protein V5786_06040 [Psychromonas sp.]